jgi:hypothetical protein
LGKGKIERKQLSHPDRINWIGPIHDDQFTDLARVVEHSEAKKRGLLLVGWLVK